jgi:hypothetical protein
MNICQLIDRLILAWQKPGNSLEVCRERIYARLDLEAAIYLIDETSLKELN